MIRTLSWFSAGAASAVATKLMLLEGPCEAVYCETGAEHEDNQRFIADCEKWFGQPVIRIHSEKRYYGKGYCSAHYQRWRTHGSPTAGQTPRYAARQEIYRALATKDKIACWIWQFNRVAKGYGLVLWQGRMSYANRIVCELAHGEPPSPSHHAAHSCGKSSCINPHHLSWKTPKENEADKHIHGTSSQGEGNARAKLTNADVQEILRLRNDGMTQPALAKQFGVTQSVISNVLNGKRWTHITKLEGATNGR